MHPEIEDFERLVRHDAVLSKINRILRMRRRRRRISTWWW